MLRPNGSRAIGLYGLLVAGFLGGTCEANAQSFTVLHHFATDFSEGAGVASPLVEGPGGFYGVASAGGAGDFGTAFKITSSGTFTRLHVFTGGPDGGVPLYLVNGGDGNLYGLTTFATVGLVSYPGTFFKMTPAGAVTTLHYFAADESEGFQSLASLTLGSDGNLYGTAWVAGTSPNTYGTVYRMTLGGTLTILHDFGVYGDAGGTSPLGVGLGTDMNLYGLTLGGGANNLGAIFKIDGGYSVIHSMSASDGSLPGGGHAAWPMFEGSDGSFYGTSSEGATNGGGSAWKVTKAGVLTVLHAFLDTDGDIPYAGVIQANDLNVYGSTNGGGQDGLGVLYQLTPSGSYTPFHVFRLPGTDGAVPFSAPIQGADGYLYGATYGGNSGVGVLYKASLPPSVLTIVPTSGPAAGGTSTSITGTSYVSGATVAFGGVSATANVSGVTTIGATSPVLMPGGTLNDVTVTNPDTSFGTGQKAWLADFLDVPQADNFHSYVEKVFRHGITAGAGGGLYGRNNPVTRAQMAVFLLKAEHGSSYVPPACTPPGLFTDVPCPGPFTNWIEQLAAESITGGCGTGMYCPGNPVTRQQMAVFLLKTEHGSSYTPPTCTGIFADVACPSTFAAWIEQLYHENVTGGCASGPLRYCPTSSVLRGQMAVFLVKTFSLP